MDLWGGEREPPFVVGLSKRGHGSAQWAAHAERDDPALGRVGGDTASGAGRDEGARLSGGLIVPNACWAGQAAEGGPRAGRDPGQRDRSRSGGGQQTGRGCAEEGC